MKNKFLKILLTFFFYCNFSFAEIYNFEVSNINFKNNGNLISASNGTIKSKEKNIEIFAEKFIYIKDKDLLEAFSGIALIGNKKIKIKFNLLKLNNQNILTASDGIQIEDLENLINIESEEIILDRNNKTITSNTISKVIDKNKNLFQTKGFKYEIKNNTININDALIRDIDNNKFEISSALINLKSNLLKGEDIIINLNNKFLNPGNEPRLIGKKVNFKNNITEISTGKFTACKRTDDCPPWELTADKITHDRNKKSISYENVWLKIYDTPVVYFPKFFHPDPSVKRQTGFLMPSFKSSPNNNTFLSIPYYKVINETEDFTFTPRLYAKNQIMLQNEYRKVNKNSKFTTDFSIFNDDGNKLEGHFFYNLNKDLKFEKFDSGKLQLKFETASNDTYIKANKLTSPIINNYDLIEKSLNIDFSSVNLDVSTDFIVYENLNKPSNDRYEYIFPKIDLTKKIENKTNLNGEFQFSSENFIHNYDTNIIEKVNTNNLLFNSNPRVTKNGFYNNYEFILKNSNTNSQKSKFHKEGEDFYYSGLIQFNSSYPLIKENKNKRKLFKPKFSLKYSPGHTKDISSNSYLLDVNSIFNLDRISSNETLEGGMSLTYGSDYIVTKKNTNQEFFSLKLANNLRLKENEDLEKDNQIGAKTSNFFGEMKYNPLSFLTTTYNFSVKNNLTDINYQNLISEIKINNFTTTLDYLKKDHDKTSYFLNKTSYNLNESNNLSFSTRRNLKTDLTEFYNLIYQYKNDCLAASIEYNKEYYNDRDIKPEESIFFRLTIIPFGTTSSPNLKQ